MRKFAATVLLVVAVSCYRGNPGSNDTSAPAVLRVENQSFDDMNIFVLPAGQSRIRLGLAIGKSDQTFVIPAGEVRGFATLRFLATPIGTPRGPVSEEISVSPGDTVVLTIPPG